MILAVSPSFSFVVVVVVVQKKEFLRLSDTARVLIEELRCRKRTIEDEAEFVEITGALM